MTWQQLKQHADYEIYSEYDDDLYRAEFLNKHPDNDSGFGSVLIANNRDPNVNSRPSSNSRNPFSRNNNGGGGVLSSLTSRGYE